MVREPLDRLTAAARLAAGRILSFQSMDKAKAAGFGSAPRQMMEDITSMLHLLPASTLTWYVWRQPSAPAWPRSALPWLSGLALNLMSNTPTQCLWHSSVNVKGAVGNCESRTVQFIPSSTRALRRARDSRSEHTTDQATFVHRHACPRCLLSADTFSKSVNCEAPRQGRIHPRPRLARNRKRRDERLAFQGQGWTLGSSI